MDTVTHKDQTLKKEQPTLYIRKALPQDLDRVLLVEQLAFGHDQEAQLVRELLNDPSAQPVVSLIAFQGGRAVGHILFTSATLKEAKRAVSIAILAPLAVVPDAQKQGIGGKLIHRGLELLANAGIHFVFVLGHPDYYPRYGFKPAGKLGFKPPYPIADEHADAWMVQALGRGVMGPVGGKVLCAEALNKPEYWSE